MLQQAVLSPHQLVQGELGSVTQQPSQVWLIGAVLGIGCTVIPGYLMNYSLAQFGATRMAMIGSAGPVLTIALAWFALGEQPSAIQGVGMVITIAAATFMALYKQQQPQDK